MPEPRAKTKYFLPRHPPALLPALCVMSGTSLDLPLSQFVHTYNVENNGPSPTGS